MDQVQKDQDQDQDQNDDQNLKPLPLFKFWRRLSVKNPNKFQNKIYKQFGNDRKKQEEFIKKNKYHPKPLLDLFNLDPYQDLPSDTSPSVSKIITCSTQRYMFPFDFISIILGFHIGGLLAFLFSYF